MQDWQAYQVAELPEAATGRFSVRVVDVDTPQERRADGAVTPPGRYRLLIEHGNLGPDVWMSDTRYEIADHGPAIDRIEDGAQRVLINGLGLGLIVRAAILAPTVRSVDVIEYADDVIRLVGPAWQRLARERGVRLAIHHANAFDDPLAGGRWDVAWHDIWPSIPINAGEADYLEAMYHGRAGWQGSWARTLASGLPAVLESPK